MITQQQIVDRLNKLEIDYNLTWFDISMDADKAIYKINNYLGTKYPKMSDILLSPNHTYTIRYKGVDVPIFPEEYIINVVIPYIAMEVLSRDQEFDQIYNKYAIDVERGLYDMSQKEFNNIPYAFRQNPGIGVLFPKEHSMYSPSKYGGNEYKYGPGSVYPSYHNRPEYVPEFKFKVTYHVNNPDILFDAGQIWVADNETYEYGSTLVVKDWEHKTMISGDGCTAYTFNGWSRSNSIVSTDMLEAGDNIVVTTDIHLYAIWGEQPTLSIDPEGYVHLDNKYKNNIINLVIPEYIGGRTVRGIPSDFLYVGSASKLKSIRFPKQLNVIEDNAIKIIYNEVKIIFSEKPISNTYAGLTIKSSGIYTATRTSIIIPDNVVALSTNALILAGNSEILCRILEHNKPEAWEDGWYYSDDNQPVRVEWGYNGKTSC